jgi:hypothetical protein
MNERETIEHRFRSDIAKVLGLIALYGSHAAGVYNDSPEQLPDLLRAAIVLLHASLEDLFRSIAEWKLPLAAPESLERIPLASSEKDHEKFSLVDLAEFRGYSVDDVIARSVGKFLERSSFNHPGDLTEVLRKIGIDLKIRKDLRDKLAAMMSRRHWIAHRVDRDLMEPIDPNRPQLGQPIQPELVIEWKNAVIQVGEAVLAEV